MPPPPPPPLQPQLLPLTSTPRLILYAQTHHTPSGTPISLLPLLTNPTGVTHVIVAAIHLNEGPGNITLNDHHPDDKRFDQLWAEVRWLQGAGVKVMGMLGGAARGSFERLGGSDAEFNAYYLPLAAVIRKHNLQGLDLDIEEPVPLSTPLRLLSRLRADFGPAFLLTLAPTATALLPGLPHLSGFSYFELERAAGGLISWYNTQFYCGWGDAAQTAWYDAIMAAGWPAEKVVLGVVTNPGNGAGHVCIDGAAGGVRRAEDDGAERKCGFGDVLRILRARYPRFGGVMGWEYFNAGGGEVPPLSPWAWVQALGQVVRCSVPVAPGMVEGGRGVERPAVGGQAQWPGQLPAPQVSWPGEDVEMLVGLGFGRQQAVAALNVTEGNVEMAAGLLFGD
ncbi:hypothetical protein W97_07276 [Coniosporium apollinis CBS 100218]|uniref:Uncharacterized protein n=1 Tax=Coniosporium apollinis (strain CBS 100218) TaxID=1168221 RepID=R7Z222_CONA1|nr:uncharacterized protein W97_07276 [Coniosporium apollinis CBS 100218]EON68128.1 hypothetical protein W97_07276 [Coniosporium apollinis CBS 100218]